MLIEDDSKILRHPLLVFYPTDSSATHIRGKWKTMCAGITPATAKAHFAQVLRNSPRAMPLPGYELVRPEITCNENALLCFH